MNKIKYLTKVDLEQHFFGIEQYKPGDESTRNLYVAVSSGTTTRRPSIHVTFRPLEKRDSVHMTWFKPLKSVLRFFYNRHMALQHAYKFLMTDTAERILILDHRDYESPDLNKLIHSFKPLTLNGIASHIIAWGQGLEDVSGIDLRNDVTLIQTIGEFLTQSLRDRLVQLFPNAMHRNAYMFAGGNFPCEDCLLSSGDRHHFLEGDDVTRLTVVDTDADGVGEIVATTHELENFRTGDLGKLDSTPCVCGKNPTLILFGRKDHDRIPILGALFLKSELIRILEPFAKQVTDYQLRVGEIECNEKFVGVAEFIFVMNSKQPISKSMVARHLSKNLFVTKTRVLEDIVDARIFCPLVVRCVDSIPIGKKKILLRRMTTLELSEFFTREIRRS